MRVDAAPGGTTWGTLRGPWLAVLRGAWAAVVFALVALYAFSIPLQIKFYETVCLNPGACSNSQITAAQIARLQQSGLSLSFYSYFTTTVVTFSVAVSLIVAAVIFWRKSDDWMGIASLVLFLFGITITSPFDSLVAVYPGLRALVGGLTAAAGTGMAGFIYVFPDGRFAPRWTRWVLPFVAAREIMAVVMPSDLTVSYLLAPELASAALVIIYRYMRTSSAVERTQTRWVVFGTLTTLIGFVGIVFMATVVLPPERISVFAKLAALTAFYCLSLLIPLSIGIAILRWHLWDIDIIIRRTLVYTVLTVALVLVYLGCVLISQEILRGVTGEARSGPATVVSTLAIAALFQPLRRRIQTEIDRRFYRRKYDAGRVLIAFGAVVRDEVDLARLTEHLTAAVEEAMQPQHVSLWLPRSGKE